MRFAKPGFQFGLKRPLVVREEIVRNHAQPCRLAYASDIHLRKGRSQMLGDQIMDALRLANPDAILLGGDLVDQASELPELERLLGRMLEMAPVFAIPGNHDVAVGKALVEETVVLSGACWMDGRTVDFHQAGRIFSISGPGGKPSTDADVRICCAHKPSIWRTAREAGFDLVLAGHLHGCQVVWFEAGGRLYPGAVFYPHNFIRQSWRTSRLVVGMGCSDLFPVRWGCPREIVLCIL